MKSYRFFIIVTSVTLLWLTAFYISFVYLAWQAIGHQEWSVGTILLYCSGIAVYGQKGYRFADQRKTIFPGIQKYGHHPTHEGDSS